MYPRALPWAVFLLGFQPVFARTHDCCTILCAIFLFGLRPVFACNIGYCMLRWAIFLLGLRPVIAHKDKRKIFLLHRSNDHLHNHLSVCKSVKKFNNPSQYSRICNQEQDCAQIRKFCNNLYMNELTIIPPVINLLSHCFDTIEAWE